MEPIYQNLDIQDSSNLLEVAGRFICIKCKESRKFFCYKCSLTHPEYKEKVPRVKLPVKIDIIKHRQENHGKSTSSHAKILAPDDVNIYEYPDVPDYSTEADDVILIFPSTTSVSISSLFKGVTTFEYKENHGLEKGFRIGTLMKTDLTNVMSDNDKLRMASEKQTNEKYTLENLPFKRAVFIDSTWKQCRGIFKDPKINSIKSCIIQNRITKFWRHQKGAPKWYLSTIEAIHQFLIEFHISAWGISQQYNNDCLNDLQLDASFIPLYKIVSEEEVDHDADPLCKPYNGQYDNILFFFSFLHGLIHSLDDVNGKLKPISKIENLKISQDYL